MTIGVGLGGIGRGLGWEIALLLLECLGWDIVGLCAWDGILRDWVGLCGIESRNNGSTVVCVLAIWFTVWYFMGDEVWCDVFVIMLSCAVLHCPPNDAQFHSTPLKDTQSYSMLSMTPNPTQ
eukprot:1236154-Amorphochlora_amoeboformis.AAC.2